MIRFRLDFEPHGFEKRMIEETKEEVRVRLAGTNIFPLLVTLRKAFASREILLDVRGEDEDVVKAKQLLGLA